MERRSPVIYKGESIFPRLIPCYCAGKPPDRMQKRCPPPWREAIQAADAASGGLGRGHQSAALQIEDCTESCIFQRPGEKKIVINAQSARALILAIAYGNAA